MARVRIAVSFELPKGASRQEALDYVLDAVACWHGSLRPDGWDGGDGEGDPMFYLDSQTVDGSMFYRGRTVKRLAPDIVWAKETSR